MPKYDAQSTVHLFRQQGFMADAENLQSVVKSILFLTEYSPQELFGQTFKLKRSTNLLCPEISHAFKIMSIQYTVLYSTTLHKSRHQASFDIGHLESSSTAIALGSSILLHYILV